MERRSSTSNKPDRRQKKKDGILNARGKKFRKPSKIQTLKKRHVKDTIESKNDHIDFERERKKSSARKDITDVTCVDCGKEFELPFKPRKPDVYCNECFKKRNSKKKPAVVHRLEKPAVVNRLEKLDV